MRRPQTLLAFVILVAGFAAGPSITKADGEPVEPTDENRDVAIPTSPGPDSRPATGPAVGNDAITTSSPQIFAAAAVPSGPVIEDFRYDKLKLEGRAAEVCRGSLGKGSEWTFYEIVERFGGQAGSMYECRERWDAANDPDCIGTSVNPISNPNFMSGCWSNHAQGRAIDVMVGTFGSGYNTARGVSIIGWLLARDAYGNVNANARRLGIQQILFNNRCWNSDGDRGIIGWSTMRECDVGHQNHVHIDLTESGASGAVSYWGATPPPPAPQLDTLVLWEQQSAWREVVAWHNRASYGQGGAALPGGYDRAIVGDWNSDGSQAEIMIWDSDTGNWFIQTWAGGSSVRARMGMWSVRWDAIIPGDWDGDTHVDDMMFYDQNTGYWVIYSWSNFSATAQASGSWNSSAWDRLINGDFDGDGLMNDLMLWDRDKATLALYEWNGFQRSFRSIVKTSTSYDDIIVGDWNSDGEANETLHWVRRTGVWVLHSWQSFRNTYRSTGYWNNTFDVATPGDLDTDGRTDELFLYDNGTGSWSVQSYHRYRWAGTMASGRWLAGFDVISSGSFMEGR